MLRVAVGETGVRAIGSAGWSMQVHATPWVETSTDLPIPRPVDASTAGATDKLRLPPGGVHIERLDGDGHAHYDLSAGSLDLHGGEFLLRVDDTIITYVRFAGDATITEGDASGVCVEFPGRTLVRLGFRSRSRIPLGTITVPRTVEGVAQSLSYMSAAHRTTTAERSLPSMRGHPPLVEFGSTYEIPDRVERMHPSTDLTLELPRSLRYLVPAAPLAHYLGARVTVGGESPVLEAPWGAHEFTRLPTFQVEAADLLRRTFLLDCLVRNAGPHGVTLGESGLLKLLGLDADALYDASPSRRLRAYLDAPFERVRDRFPEWHLSMYVEPSFAAMPTLSHLLGNVPALFLPEADELSTDERLSRSLDGFYRGPGNVRATDLLKPSLQTGRVHGWLADGAPIDVFKTVPEAYENRLEYADRTDDPVSIVVVLNDGDMTSEYDTAAEIYRSWARDRDIDVTVRERLRTEELADVFESRHDFVHYIGHCEVDGLRCPDGYLSASTLSDVNVQAFFLNACGSYYEGLELVRRGSVAGAVTFDTVLDTPAARVGTIFGRLLVSGFCIERALALARRRIIMGNDYAVVGDGTHTLAQTGDEVPATVRVRRRDDGQFQLTYAVQSPRVTGGFYYPSPGEQDVASLSGSEQQFTLSQRELLELLRSQEVPVIYDGDIHWSTELIPRMSG